jgi:serine/threonine protein kinase
VLHYSSQQECFIKSVCELLYSQVFLSIFEVLGLETVHRNKLVHRLIFCLLFLSILLRDIKGENILLFDSGAGDAGSVDINKLVIKISDFVCLFFVIFLICICLGRYVGSGKRIER